MKNTTPTIDAGDALLGRSSRRRLGSVEVDLDLGAVRVVEKELPGAVGGELRRSS
jgi:hypothetical protein